MIETLCRRKSHVALIGCLLLVVMAVPCSAQENQKEFSRNAVYAELLGQGLLYSINYDRLITQELSVRVGFSRWNFPFLFGDVTFTGFPIMLNYLWGKGSSRLELGVGFVPASVEGREIFTSRSQDVFQRYLVLGTATIGYRAQPREGGFVFRVGFTPIYNGEKLFLYGGISAGVAF